MIAFNIPDIMIKRSVQSPVGAGRGERGASVLPPAQEHRRRLASDTQHPAWARAIFRQAKPTGFLLLKQNKSAEFSTRFLFEVEKPAWRRSWEDSKAANAGCSCEVKRETLSHPISSHLIPSHPIISAVQGNPGALDPGAGPKAGE